ncbi:cytochrome c oxidase subunit 3 [Amycolatopsis acididurans]|uniref:cytochrome c oxidase subunit 3 n=1 Tax=Amycolatopsis acididurans TaxID=2724524 RepID=UPI001B33F6C7|nr:cytochrome c oxidase subunit 3 [Amycolatopsis acididurans]
MPGEPGVWVLIFGDLVVFTVFFATYLHARASQPERFAAAQKALNPAYGVAYTLLLLTGSLFVATGVRAARRRAGSPAPALFAGAFGCGLAFVALKSLEYHDKIAHGLTAGTNDFFLYFYILTGVHLFHVLIGLGVLIALVAKSRHQPLPFRFLEGGATFWHLVDLLWIVLFPLLYFVR